MELPFLPCQPRMGSCSGKQQGKVDLHCFVVIAGDGASGSPLQVPRLFTKIQQCTVQSPKGKGFKYAPGHGPTVPQQCPETGSGWIMGGPFWSQPLHDQAWVKGVLDILTVSTTLAWPASAQAYTGGC